MEVKMEESENFCSLPGVARDPVQHGNSNVKKEIQTSVTKLPAEAENYHKDINKLPKDKKFVSEIPEIEYDACGHQKANLGNTFSLNCKYEFMPKIPVRRYSSAQSAFQKLSVNEKKQQHFSIEFNENLRGICEDGTKNSVHPRIKVSLVESKIVANDVSRNISGKNLPSTQRRDTRTGKTNTLNLSSKLEVDDKYPNVYNMGRSDPLPPDPVLKNPDILVSERNMTTKQVLEPCHASRNRRKNFYFSLQNSSHQESSQEFDKNLLGICEDDYKTTAHPGIEPEFVESKSIENKAARNVINKDLSYTQQIDTPREKTNTSNIPCELTVNVEYTKVYNMGRRDPRSPDPIFKNPDILMSQPIMPNKQVLEQCQASLNQRKNLYFTLGNSPDQDSPQEFDKNLLGICEVGSKNNVHFRIEPELIESEIVVSDSARNITDNDLSFIQLRDTEREQTNTSNIPCQLPVEDEYINVYNICRRNPPSTQLDFRNPDIHVSQTIMPTTEILELCQSFRNRRKKFYFPLENSPDQNSPQAKLPVSKLICKQSNKIEAIPD